MMPHRKALHRSDEPWEMEVDAALRLLNQAEPPAGMHERLHAFVEARPRHKAPGRITSAGGVRSSVFGMFAGLACACVLMAFLWHTQFARDTHHAVPSGAHRLTSRAQSVDAAPASSSAAPPSPIAARAQAFHLALTTKSGFHQGSRPEPIRAPGAALPTQAELDAQALADTQAPSHPAPTLELTAQERQASLMMRRGEKRNVASLDPAFQAVRAEQVQADFQNFLHPALTPFERQVERDAQRVQAGLPLINPGLSPSDSQLVTGDRK